MTEIKSGTSTKNERPLRAAGTKWASVLLNCNKNNRFDRELSARGEAIVAFEKEHGSIIWDRVTFQVWHMSFQVMFVIEEAP